jgi:hypothetical protein
MSVFQIDRNYKVIANPDAVKLVPELRGLSTEQFWYVVLVADYVDGPFRKKPPQERRILAARKVFGKDKKVKESERVKNAIEAYKGLVFDIRRETLDALKTKVQKLHNDLLRDDITPSQIQGIDKSISFLEKRILSIERDLDMEEQETLDLKAGRKLSFIEQWQRNQKQHAEYKMTMSAD